MNAEPGSDGYRLAELPARVGYHEAPSSTAGTIHRALEVARSASVGQAVQHGHGPVEVIRAWVARDEGGEPPSEPGDAFERLRYAFSSLPDDLRCRFAGEVEGAAWAYHAPDLAHVRAVARRDAEAEAAREVERRAEWERRDAEAAERAEAEGRAREERAREAAEQAQAGAEAEAAQVRTAEDQRRQSEEARRAGMLNAGDAVSVASQHDVDREQVLAYAEQHGAQAAAEKFEVSAGTIRSWRHRQRTPA